MAHAPNGDLSERIASYRDKQKPIPETTVLSWFAQAVAAVSYLHMSGLVHRDIKTSNLLLDANDNVLLCDFGIACRVGEPRKNHKSVTVGTPMYMAPEIVEGSNGDEKADIWSLGCVLYELLMLTPAFSSKSMTKMLHHILHCKYNTAYPSLYSAEIIGACLSCESR